MIFLFVSELNGYLRVEEYSEMYVASDLASKKIRVNIDITFPSFPCDIFSLDA
jgi:hypothetical protein